jgi:DNA polymerase III epsilon subunit-like protein
MIVVDIETSGNLEPNKIGIWQIGAIELENPENTFLQEARIDESDEIEEIALKVTGKTEEELRDKNKQSQKQLLSNFFDWVKKIPFRDLIVHNTQFDYSFLYVRAKMYGLDFPFSHQAYDLHSIAAIKYFEINGGFLTEEGNSKMNLSNVLKFCGMEDERINIKEGQVIKEGKPHNGLEDAKLEAECFSRIVFGRNLIQEYANFPIPSYLITKK